MFGDAQILFFAITFLASLFWMWWRLLDCAEESAWARAAQLANEAQLRRALAARRPMPAGQVLDWMGSGPPPTSAAAAWLRTGASLT